MDCNSGEQVRRCILVDAFVPSEEAGEAEDGTEEETGTAERSDGGIC